MPPAPGALLPRTALRPPPCPTSASPRAAAASTTTGVAAAVAAAPLIAAAAADISHCAGGGTAVRATGGNSSGSGGSGGGGSGGGGGAGGAAGGAGGRGGGISSGAGSSSRRRHHRVALLTTAAAAVAVAGVLVLQGVAARGGQLSRAAAAQRRRISGGDAPPPRWGPSRRGPPRWGPSRWALARACAAGDCARRACTAGGWAPVAYNDTGGLLWAAGGRRLDGSNGGGSSLEAEPPAAMAAATDSVGRWGALRPVPSSLAPPSHRRQRYLVVTHPNGGFNNRLIAVKNALLLGAATGRGVVVIDGRFLGDAYDLPALFPGGPGGGARDAEGEVPQLPRVEDNRQVVKALTRVSRVVGGKARGGAAHAWHWQAGEGGSARGGPGGGVPPCVAAAGADEYLALPQEALYYACPPRALDAIIYARLAPAPPLAAAAAAAADAVGLRPGAYAAAHVRSLEGTCASRAGSHATPAAVDAAGRMCRVDSPLVEAIVAASVRDGTAARSLVSASNATTSLAAAGASPPRLPIALSPQKVFLAWDGQGWWRRRVRNLRAAPWSVLLTRGAWEAATTAAVAAAATTSSTPRVVGWWDAWRGEGPRVDRARVEELLAARSGLFIGNPASSLTGNVVRLPSGAGPAVGRTRGGEVGDCVIERYG
ncbi:hypothetical protein MMPV_001550 [Pyropia vietnamensis]